ncbi:MAG: hypothetical protein ACOCYZ_06150 [Halococcoides sp.]
MTCARCGGPLETFELGGQRAVVCADCGYVDTAVGHEPSPNGEEESWDRAIERFIEKFGDAVE